ncbi:unnamed protein product [Amoebophrya sp. A25]|nr:unnamed protein product [Amoebophrya sp. A25]|eukprot:GSA25T00019600001.1
MVSCESISGDAPPEVEEDEALRIGKGEDRPTPEIQMAPSSSKKTLENESVKSENCEKSEKFRLGRTRTKSSCNKSFRRLEGSATRNRGKNLVKPSAGVEPSDGFESRAELELVGKKQHCMRLQKFVAYAFRSELAVAENGVDGSFPRAAVSAHHACEQRKVYVNGEPRANDSFVHDGDLVALELEDVRHNLDHRPHEAQVGASAWIIHHNLDEGHQLHEECGATLHSALDSKNGHSSASQIRWRGSSACVRINPGRRKNDFHDYACPCNPVSPSFPLNLLLYKTSSLYMLMPV